VSEVFRVGGAQAIAALAYGTETIPRVDKIVGPGNVYVTSAKREVFGDVGIDMLAGPSEVVVVADDSACARHVAADLLSQAEHDLRALSILLTPSEDLAEDVVEEIGKQMEGLQRRDVIEQALTNFGAIIVANDLNECIDLVNKLAPEHLELCVRDVFSVLGQVKSAGAIFLGSFTPEPLGDYLAGPNHVLPTGGTSRFFSPLSVTDFVKRSSLVYFSKEKLNALSRDVIGLAMVEGLDAHAEAIRKRVSFLEAGH
jgi:histidinol dehydrogenase